MSVNSIQSLQSDPTKLRKATKSSTSLGDFLAAVMQTQTSDTIKAASSDRSLSPSVTPSKTSFALPMPVDGQKQPSWEGLFPQPQPKTPYVSAVRRQML